MISLQINPSRSNNTNKLSPQERHEIFTHIIIRSNNTNKLSPQELKRYIFDCGVSSNNTNKLSPQERGHGLPRNSHVQIIQINLALKNCWPYYSTFMLYLQYILSISIIKC